MNFVIKKSCFLFLSINSPVGTRGTHILITSPKLLIKLYEETYLERLKHREMSPELKDLKEKKENLFDIRIKEAAKKTSEPFSKEKLIKVLKSLEKKKARDPWGLIF